MRSAIKISIGIFITSLLGFGVLAFTNHSNLVATRNWSNFTTIPVAPGDPVTIKVNVPTDNISGVGVYMSLLNKDMEGTAVFTLRQKTKAGKAGRVIFKKIIPVRNLSNNKGLTNFYWPPVSIGRHRSYELSIGVKDGIGYYIHSAHNFYYYKPIISQLRESAWGRYASTDLTAAPWLIVAIFFAVIITGGLLLKELLFTSLDI